MGVERVQHREIDDEEGILESGCQCIERCSLTANAMAGKKHLQAVLGAQLPFDAIQQRARILNVIQIEIVAM
jgi:hypothetical protein